jgi:hypothetical protein
MMDRAMVLGCLLFSILPGVLSGTKLSSYQVGLVLRETWKTFLNVVENGEDEREVWAFVG